MDLAKMIDVEKMKEKTIGFRINTQLYEYIVKGDEKNKSNEFRRCVYVSFIFKKYFDMLAEENEKLFQELFLKLDRYSQWELTKFAERYQES